MPRSVGGRLFESSQAQVIAPCVGDGRLRETPFIPIRLYYPTVNAPSAMGWRKRVTDLVARLKVELLLVSRMLTVCDRSPLLTRARGAGGGAGRIAPNAADRGTFRLAGSLAVT